MLPFKPTLLQLTPKFMLPVSGEVGVIVPPALPPAPPVKHGTLIFPPIVTPQFGGVWGLAVMLPVAWPVTDTVELAVND